MAEFVRAMAVTELAPGACKELSVSGRAVAVYNVGGEFYATTNTCIHRGGPLGQGSLDGCVVMCPWHTWTFDVRTGESTVNPDLKVASYAVRVEDGQVLIAIP
jgi:nitrite reductase/ring-hydroxylating ferredoxin subunit